MSDFARSPFIAIRETTRACALARVHCRAETTGDPPEEAPGCAWQPGDVPVFAGGSDASAVVVSEPAVTHALGSVVDPELGMSIVDLGLVYGISVDGACVRVTMTLTAPGCPIHDAMAQWVRAAVMTVPGVERVDVDITFDPPWTPDRVTR